MAAKGGRNELLIGGEAYLLTETGGGSAVHLTRRAASSDEPRGALDGFSFDDERPFPLDDRYDREKLLDPIWAATTLCGRLWARMAAGDGGPFEKDGEIVYAPDCRRCMSIMDKSLPGIDPTAESSCCQTWSRMRSSSSVWQKLIMSRTINSSPFGRLFGGAFAGVRTKAFRRIIDRMSCT